MIEPLLLMRRPLDMRLPLLEQMALFDFLHKGHYARHMRHHYQKLRDLLYRELQAHLGGLLEVRAPEAGMHLVGWLPPGKDDRRAAELAAHLTDDGSFVVEAFVPTYLTRLRDDQYVHTEAITVNKVWLDVGGKCP